MEQNKVLATDPVTYYTAGEPVPLDDRLASIVCIVKHEEQVLILGQEGEYVEDGDESLLYECPESVIFTADNEGVDMSDITKKDRYLPTIQRILNPYGIRPIDYEELFRYNAHLADHPVDLGQRREHDYIVIVALITKTVSQVAEVKAENPIQTPVCKFMPILEIVKNLRDDILKHEEGFQLPFVLSSIDVMLAQDTSFVAPAISTAAHGGGILTTASADMIAAISAAVIANISAGSISTAPKISYSST